MPIFMTPNVHVIDIENNMRTRDNKGHFVKEEFNDYEIYDQIVHVITGTDIFYIDIQDLELISKYRWRIAFARKESLTQKSYSRVEATKDGKSFKLHRFLLNAQKDQIVDHIDQNPLNNCRNNLRFVTASQNQRNRKARKTSTSRFKGCYVDKTRKKWSAQIRVNRKVICLGRFNTEEQAAEAYENAELKYFGDAT